MKELVQVGNVLIREFKGDAAMEFKNCITLVQFGPIGIEMIFTEEEVKEVSFILRAWLRMKAMEQGKIFIDCDDFECVNRR